MADNEKTRLTVYFPPITKEDLKDMAEQTGLSQTQLVVIATHSLIENYKVQGNAIFKNLVMKPK